MRTFGKQSIKAGMRLPMFRQGVSSPSTLSASDMNLFVRCLNAFLNLEIVNGAQNRFEISDERATFQLGIDNYKTGGGGRGTSQIAMYLLRDVQDDYLMGHSWDGTTEGTSPIYIAKEWQHRTSIASIVQLGITHTYTYSAGVSESWVIGTDTRFNKKRTNSTTSPSNSEDDFITPPWSDGELIFAIPATTALTVSGNPVSLLIAGRSCQWATSAFS